ncbi:MAG: hypothetical protein ACI80I_001267 [Akkermansiaceae bacterium]|jgi:hypothetical protein
MPSIGDGEPISIYAKRGPVEVVGGFLYVPPETEKDGYGYYGDVSYKIPDFGLRVVGGFEFDRDAKFKSFFVYGNTQISPPLGSPSFRITGVAGGFGVNHRLTLPAIDDVSKFALLPGNAPLEEKTTVTVAGEDIDTPFTDPVATVTAALKDLTATTKDGQDVVPVMSSMPGAYWIGLGVEFTSFEMIKGFVLLTFSEAAHPQIDLLGAFEMNFPAEKKKVEGTEDTKKERRLAHLETYILTSINPSAGVISIDGVVSDSSYVLAKPIKVSGGYAFCKWCSGSNSGDTVVTAGGYHPAYDVPAGYPLPARLQCKFSMGGLESTGQAYFALTPNALMAGLQVKTTLKMESISAWYELGADFLCRWAPFHYEGSAYVHIGVIADLGLFKVHCSAGVDLELWGPEFGGRAKVDLSVVSFTIKFGAERNDPPPVGWDSYRDSFMPRRPSKIPDSDITFLTSAARLGDTASQENSDLIWVKTEVAGAQQNCNSEQYDWILDPNGFEIETQSALPINAPLLNKSKVSGAPGDYNLQSINSPDLRYDAKDDDPSTRASIWETQIYLPFDAGQGPEEPVNTVLTHDIRLTSGGHDFSAVSICPVMEPIQINIASSTPDGSVAGLASSGGEIKYGLMGFKIGPIPRHPDVLSSIPLYYLVYQMDSDPTNFVYTGAEPNTVNYSISSALIDEPSPASLRIEVTDKVQGETITMTGQNRILSALKGVTDPSDNWVEQKRTTILSALSKNFDTHAPDDVDLSVMATSKALVDWPMTGLLGAE